ncbi:Ger(x)C family spore germination protein [Paenibacillus massiliensis]|uniref:Ger(x)C family spore germination protein n=1 Tax=Paenibacillus massiliensis TaxID=225917 RepID=UPI00048D8E2E|nr:Ger(x)C family spore germination protein [Paenibacillus massiliensis]
MKYKLWHRTISSWRWQAMLFLPLTLSLFLTGCWERQELNELAFIVGVGIDKLGDKYNVSMQAVIPSEVAGKSSGYSTPVTIYQNTVDNVYDALREFTLMSPRQSYLGHIRVLIIGEELAREGISPVLDVFKRSREPRMDFYVMVARDSQAAEILSVLTPLEKLPANKLFNSLDRSSKATATTTTATLDQIIEDLFARGLSPVLTGVIIDGGVGEGMEHSNVESVEPKTKLRYRGIAIFQKDKMVGWLDEKEAIGYNYMTDKVVTNTGFVMGTDDRPIIMEALRTSTDREVKFIDGRPHIYIKVKTISNVQDVPSEMDIGTTEAMNYLTKEAEEKTVKLMQTAYNRILSKYNIDAMGFGHLIYQHNPQAWFKFRGKYGDDYLAEIPVHFSAKIRITRIGTLDKSFRSEVKE